MNKILVSSLVVLWLVVDIALRSIGGYVLTHWLLCGFFEKDSEFCRFIAWSIGIVLFGVFGLALNRQSLFKPAPLRPGSSESATKQV